MPRGWPRPPSRGRARSELHRRRWERRARARVRGPREAAARPGGGPVGGGDDKTPADELRAHYAREVAALDEHDISMPAPWHASREVVPPVPTRDSLSAAFPSRGQHRREALKLAGGF